eukprot:jgi/Mesvir1/28667/Mv21283-RA.1
MALVPRRETPAPPSLVPTKLKQGKAHSLAFRERIAIAVHSAKTSDPKRPLSEVAEMFAVDRKTAYKYYQWWKQDRENGVDYSNPDHLKNLFKVKARLVRRKESKKAQEPPPPPYTPLPLRQDFRQVIVEGRYADVFPTRVNQVAGQVGFLPEVEQLWKKSGQDAVMLPDAVSSGAMRDTFWSFLPGWNARRGAERSTIADYLATVTTLPSPEDKLEFVIRLAAHDFVMMHYIRRHNYPVKQRIYGDEISDPTSLAEFAKDFPPGVMFKNVTPCCGAGTTTSRSIAC